MRFCPKSRKRTPLKTGRSVIRLLLAFAMMIAIVLAIGQLGLNRIDQVNANQEDILVRQRKKVQLARDALDLSNQGVPRTGETQL